MIISILLSQEQCPKWQMKISSGTEGQKPSDALAPVFIQTGAVKTYVLLS